MGTIQRDILYRLDAIEFELRRMAYWQEVQPSAKDLSSVQPFCCDTLEFPQWLQFVFLRKMRLLLDSNAPLPTTCGIAPYAEEYFKQDNKDTASLLEHLRAIDSLLTTV